MRRLLILAALGLTPAAHSQIFSVYGTFSPSQFSNVQTGSLYTASTNTYQQQYTSFWSQGFGGGVTFGILPIGPIHIGLDLRGSTKSGTSGADTAAIGLRIGVKPPLIKIKPYIEAAGSYIQTRTPNNSNFVLTNTGVTSSSSLSFGTYTNQYGAWEIIGGIDYPLLRILDFRVIEIGGGQGYNFGGSSNSGTPTAGAQISILTINSGVVLHF
jgi:hypothetical protein